MLDWKKNSDGIEIHLRPVRAGIYSWAAMGPYPGFAGGDVLRCGVLIEMPVRHYEAGARRYRYVGCETPEEAMGMCAVWESEDKVPRLWVV